MVAALCVGSNKKLYIYINTYQTFPPFSLSVTPPADSMLPTQPETTQHSERERL